MIKFFLLILVSTGAYAQTLPKKDNGILLSFNISNRHIPSAISQKSIKYINVDFRKNWNYNNNISFKSGASIFVTGHKWADPGNSFGYNPEPASQRSSVYGYLRIPGLLSYNFKNFYIDIGGAPCLRLFHTFYTQKGEEQKSIGLTYTLESHIGYYIPVKKRRLFVEFGTYLSEIQSGIYLPAGNYNAYYNNEYSLNLQLGVGIMFNKSIE